MKTIRRSRPASTASSSSPSSTTGACTRSSTALSASTRARAGSTGRACRARACPRPSSTRPCAASPSTCPRVATSRWTRCTSATPWPACCWRWTSRCTVSTATTSPPARRRPSPRWPPSRRQHRHVPTCRQLAVREEGCTGHPPCPGRTWLWAALRHPQRHRGHDRGGARRTGSGTRVGLIGRGAQPASSGSSSAAGSMAGRGAWHSSTPCHSPLSARRRTTSLSSSRTAAAQGESFCGGRAYR